MPSKHILQKEIEALPPELADEVYDYINYLKRKQVKEKMQNALLSESSLGKDWLSAEEDEAWRNL